MRTHKKSNTCIVALKNSKGKVLIGADLRSSWGWSKSQGMNKPKVKKIGNMIIAATGDGALCGLFVDAFIPPVYKGEDLDMFMQHTFYSKIKKVLISREYVSEHRLLKVPADGGCELIIGIAGRVYSVDIHNPDEHAGYPNGMISIDEVSLPYTSGCGGEHAKGAIDALYQMDVKDTRQIARMALLVAAANSPGCGDGFTLVTE